MTALTVPVPERVLPDLEQKRAPIEDLADFPGNPRIHDLDAIAEVLREFGQVEPLLVNEGTKTGRGRELIAGHGRITIMREHGWRRPAVTVGDWTDEEARKLVAGMNGASRNADVDPDLMDALLAPVQDDLVGSTWTIADLDALREARDAALEEQLDEGAPGSADELEPPDDADMVGQWAVMVVCRDERHQEEVHSALKAQGYTLRVVSV